MSRTLSKLVAMFQRAKDGPACSVREWEIKVVPQTVREYLKKYDLEHTFNKDVPINQDLTLADRFFEAGLDLAVEIGFLCPDTETVIKVSKKEILQAIKEAPSQLILGEGPDRFALKARKIEDKNPPTFCGPLCIQVDEELFVPIVEGILQSKKIRIEQGPSLDTIFGTPVYSGTPLESMVAFLENQLKKEAQWRAGRPGIANMGIGSSTTEYGQLAGFAGITKKSNPAIGIILNPAGLKVCFAGFHKAAMGIGYDGYYYCCAPTMIGGYSGGAEGTALSNIAGALLQFPVLQVDFCDTSIYDVRFNSSCGRHGLWANSISNQAIARNTSLINYKIVDQTAGPCTEELFYTSAAGLVSFGVCGLAATTGPRSAGGRYKNYLTPLEHWLCADIFEASTKLTLEEANELVLYLLSKYESGLLNTPKGKSFTECFNIKTLTPTKEYQELADRIKADLEAHGLAID